jgi:hypothetical protein
MHLCPTETVAKHYGDLTGHAVIDNACGMQWRRFGGSAICN